MAEKTNVEKNDTKEKIMHEVQKAGKEIQGLLKTAKAKYDSADPKTKKAVIAGIAGAAALIATAIGMKKAKDKCKK